MHCRALCVKIKDCMCPMYVYIYLVCVCVCVWVCECVFALTAGSQHRAIKCDATAKVTEIWPVKRLNVWLGSQL